MQGSRHNNVHCALMCLYSACGHVLGHIAIGTVNVETDGRKLFMLLAMAGFIVSCNRTDGDEYGSRGRSCTLVDVGQNIFGRIKAIKIIMTILR